MTKLAESRNIINDAIIKDISDSIHGIHDGIVTIKVHDSRIMKIEVTQENRYEDIWTVEDGGGI
jgi:hypothetical protein